MDRQEQIEFLLDHYENPRNKGKLENADAAMTWGNPGCGDIITMYANVGPDEKLTAVTFEGQGCTISQASASVLTEWIKGKTLADIESMGHEELIDLLGRDVVMTRTRCALLSLDALKLALKEYERNKVRAENNTTIQKYQATQN
ncbi:iron-sulfur cluster assembly scaffold protein [Candidatus Acetothermia bacterium]|nr:iron-sulfur cluster assembly scaffold protein [Candidatus Acetothermia bacterium]MBI3460356.1 iron-sulfur cluster assembly scaffold protein [Candidatus Acetothermia bacterium]MBI3660483.1 iron-sulfur cluster assembly scaffold protein [Candidatus Acetothermia bacterium]